MLELLSGADAGIAMQIAVALLREPLAAAVAGVGARLRVGPRVVHGARLDGELALADGARQAEFQPARPRIHHVAPL